MSRDVTCDKNKVDYKYLNHNGSESKSNFSLPKENEDDGKIIESPFEKTTNVELSDYIELKLEDPSSQLETLPKPNINASLPLISTIDSTSSHEVNH